MNVSKNYVNFISIHASQRAVQQIITRSSVLQLEVLVLKLCSVDALAAGAVVIGKVTTLAHEAWNDAME